MRAGLIFALVVLAFRLSDDLLQHSGHRPCGERRTKLSALGTEVKRDDH